MPSTKTFLSLLVTIITCALAFNATDIIELLKCARLSVRRRVGGRDKPDMLWLLGSLLPREVVGKGTLELGQEDGKDFSRR